MYLQVRSEIFFLQEKNLLFLCNNNPGYIYLENATTMPNPFPLRHGLALILILYCCYAAKGQTLVNSTGNTVKDNSYYIVYSIGEICISTLSGSTNNITQGLIQPNIKKTPPPCDFLDDKVISFENPTRNIVRIIGQYDWITDYKVYTADGKMVKGGAFRNNAIDLTKFPAAMYFIRLYPGCNGKFKVLKVLKQL